MQPEDNNNTPSPEPENIPDSQTPPEETQPAEPLPKAEVKISNPVPLENLTFADPQKNLKHSHVFLCRGSNEEMLSNTLALLESFGIQSIITNDPQNLKPLTSIVTEYPTIDFAIIILSADDFVYFHNDKPANAFMKADQRVVFELGFWIGKLGRDKVSALFYDQKRFRLPVEFYNAITITFDKKGLWKQELARRLEFQGFMIKNKEKL